MKKLRLLILLWIFPYTFISGMAYFQDRLPENTYSKKGLIITKQILTELNFPDWYWAGGHLIEKIEQNYQYIDGDLLYEYFSETTKRPTINDPQNLLNSRQRKRIEELISAHDMKSALPIYLNVLAHGQKIAMLKHEVLASLRNQFNDENALVIFYYFGQALEVQGYTILDGEVLLDDWEVSELFLKSAREASVRAEDFSELESFTQELSRRSYWLEQKLMPPVAAVEVNASQEKNDNQENNFWNEALRILTESTLNVGLALLSIVAGGLYYIWSRKWRNYSLPSDEVPIRLGAKYGASVSIIVDFSDPKKSLVSQYEKVKSKEF